HLPRAEPRAGGADQREVQPGTRLLRLRRVQGSDQQRRERDGMSTKKVRVGVVGCGRCAQDHLQAYQKDETAHLVAVADMVESLARSVGEQYGAAPYVDYRKMIEREKLDAISICTPPVTHGEIMLNALPQVHVLCEKPLT